MSAALLNALYTKILTSTGAGGFANTFGSRVFLDRAGADTSLPLCVYTATQLVRVRTMNSSSQHSLTVVFAMYDGNLGSSTIVTGQLRLRTLLDGAVLATVSGYDRATVILREQGVPRFEDDSWSIEDQYEIIGQLTS